jgi:flagellar biosynthesis GTPase FlhF
MELKRILARDTRSAMEQAIKTYGPDVLVISNHQVSGQTELVVAIEAPASEAAPVAQLNETHSATQAAAASDGAAAHAEADAPVQNFRRSLQAATQSAARNAAEPAAPANEAHTPVRSDQDARDYLRSREIVGLVRDEIAALRREFRMRQQTSAWQSGLSLAPTVAPLAQALQDTDMPGALLALLLQSLGQASDGREGLQILREQLLHALKRPAAELPTRGLHLLAGPSGAGKTLMAARLARRAAQAGCEQVALISFQDVRAGAWSQMQMLAAQLGVDAFRATDAQSLRVLIEELSHRQLVLIDTPGVQMATQVQQVLALAPSCQCHAVVPVDASAATLQRVFGQGLPLQSLLLTKVDEASSGWALLQFLSNNGIGLSGASESAHPSDLSPDFNIEQLVDLALAPLAAASSDELRPLSLHTDPALGTPPSAGEPAGLSAILAGIAGLPSVPAFTATADVLGTGVSPMKSARKTSASGTAASPRKSSPRSTKAAGTPAAASTAGRTRKTSPKAEAAPAARAPRRKAAEATVQA